MGRVEKSLGQAEWSRPGLVLLEHGDGLKEHDTAGLYHGGWAFRKTAFDRIGVANDRRPWRHARISELVFELFESLVVSVRRVLRIVPDDQLTAFAKAGGVDTTPRRWFVIQQYDRPADHQSPTSNRIRA